MEHPVFPVLIIFGFYFAYSGNSQDILKVGVIGTTAPAALNSSFLKTKYIQFVPLENQQSAVQKLRHHQMDLLVQFTPPLQYWINTTSPKGYLAEKLLKLDSTPFAVQTVEGGEIRYVDWLISGLLAMNMMFSALFGIGYTLVRYRKTGVLKRFRVTPLTAFEFLAAQILSRILILGITTAVVYWGTHQLIHFQMLGSYVDLTIVFFLGAACLMALGLLVACRTSSEEFAGGMLNLLSWPMMFLSGVWFSLDGAPTWLHWVARIFPLTHMIEASRAIMTEGTPLRELTMQVSALSGMTAVCLVCAAALFRWK